MSTSRRSNSRTTTSVAHHPTSSTPPSPRLFQLCNHRLRVRRVASPTTCGCAAVASFRHRRSSQLGLLPLRNERCRLSRRRRQRSDAFRPHHRRRCEPIIRARTESIVCRKAGLRPRADRWQSNAGAWNRSRVCVCVCGCVTGLEWSLVLYRLKTTTENKIDIYIYIHINTDKHEFYINNTTQEHTHGRR